MSKLEIEKIKRMLKYIENSLASKEETLVRYTRSLGGNVPIDTLDERFEVIKKLLIEIRLLKNILGQ